MDWFGNHEPQLTLRSKLIIAMDSGGTRYTPVSWWGILLEKSPHQDPISDKEIISLNITSS